MDWVETSLEESSLSIRFNTKSVLDYLYFYSAPPPIFEVVTMLNVPTVHLLVIIKTKKATLIRPYESLHHDYLFFTPEILHIGPNRINVNKVEMEFTDSRNYIRFS